MALQATAWRLLGDARYGEWQDYEALVSRLRVELPAGLQADLESLHRFGQHPFQQSVRGGGQLPLHAVEMERPAIRTLFESITQAADRRLASMGRGADPFRSRNTGRMRLTGAWSIRLSSGGFHTDHVHPRGWLSAVCYIDIPSEVQASAKGERAGWLRLGRPGIRTTPALLPDHFVKPEPGLLVLFPAYMWHGVERFESASARLTVALDALPG
jgi:uncharacterized protein (TIGR02466 family)